MKFKTKMVVFLAILCLLAINTASAQWVIKRQDFAEKKIAYIDFFPALLNQKGDVFIGYDILDLEHKVKGLVYALRVFKLNPDNTYQMKTIELPITFLVGLTFIDNERAMIIVGDYGTKILKVDLEQGKITTVFQYEKHKPGFRTEALVVGRYDRVFLSGYFYDKEQYAKGDYVVEMVLPKKKGQKVRFKKKINLDKIYQKVKHIPKTFNLYSGDSAFFGFIMAEKKQSVLYHYSKGKFIEVDTGLLFGSFAGTDDRVFYLVRKDKNNRFSYIKDTKTNKVWKIGKDNMPYSYPFISNQAETLVIASVNPFNQTMQTYYARESEDYELKPLKNLPIGPMKLSGDGEIYLHMSQDGVTIDYIPEEKKSDKK